jgi:flagellar hook-associated protein 3 FlgL
MRISTLSFYDRATQSMLDQQAKLSKTQQQIATGKRILTPSDDPSGAARSLNLQKQIATREQYQDNIGIVRSRLELQESTLDAATRLWQRAHELAIQGNNATVDAAGRAGMAEEVDQLLGELLGLANTKDSNGEYLFSGYQRDTQPFVDAGGGTFQYRGDQGQRLIRISAERQIGDAETGLEIFMDIPSSSGGTQDAFSMLYDLSQGLRAGADLSASINDAQLVMEKTLEMRTRAGARLKTAEEQEQVNADYLLSLQTQLSGVQDLDFAEAISRLNLQATTLEAAQQSFVRLQNLSLFNYLR